MNIKQELVNYINWEKMLEGDPESRYAGSHCGSLSNLFLDSYVLLSETTGSYQGEDLMLYLFAPKDLDVAKLVMITSYFGSCSGCDSWEGASDESLKELLEAIVRNARVFDDFEAIYKFFNDPEISSKYEFEDFLNEGLIGKLTKAEEKLAGINR